ncbi:MAG: hypothetical protein EPO41_24410 [Reyranella sp.]|uniref:hypothetical protein n=1 Tax=Reyranella sp. TaxID=1929291 RepID=UPI0012218654|nr:hypothetical protein [Reyranella sp.]TAJ86933.1 MAG: hypothetical protein EPO41_24410 [Reyranella sp.]
MTCKVEKTYEAGRSPADTPLSVVEIRLGLADKPKDQDEGCINGNGRDGGVEYWLLDGTAMPKQVLQLCNDGYGMAGVGEDEVEVGPNRLVHRQSGGSSWRWSMEVTYSLSPFRALTEQDCSYHNVSEQSGTLTDIDYRTRLVRALAKDSTRRDPGVGCPSWPKPSQAFAARIDAETVGAYPVVAPGLSGKAAIPAGTALGNCIPGMTTAGDNGFVVWGKPAPADQAAEIRTIGVGSNTLIVQVFDPVPAAAPPAGSWIHQPHLEIWVGQNGEEINTMLPLGQMTQTGVTLDGAVHRGVGKPNPPPSVERWASRDERGRPVVVLRLVWPHEFALINGVTVVYSQAEAGKQARLVATAGFAGNRPIYVPDVQTLSGRPSTSDSGLCRVQLGVLVAN